MGYSHDMSKESNKKELLPEGWRRFKIITCEEKTSKRGNEMFVLSVKDCETNQYDDIYAVATPGKRWFLKLILTACGVEAGKDGVYNWDIPDVLNKYFSGRVEHYEDKWTDREGKIRQVTKHKISDIRNDDGSVADIPTEEEAPF